MADVRCRAPSTNADNLEPGPARPRGLLVGLLRSSRRQVLKAIGITRLGEAGLDDFLRAFAAGACAGYGRARGHRAAAARSGFLMLLDGKRPML